MHLRTLRQQPPVLLDSERALIGAAMANPAQMTGVLESLQAEVFYPTLHQDIWRAVQQIYAGGGKPELVAVAERIRAKHDDAIAKCAAIIDAAGSSANAEHYAAELRARYAARSAIQACESACEALYKEPDALRAIPEAMRALEAAQNVTHKAPSADEAMDACLTRIFARADAIERGEHVGIPTGFVSLDNAIRLDEGLHFIGGWSSGGKTSLLIDWLSHAAKQGHRWRLYSLDMPMDEIVVRVWQHAYSVSAEYAQRLELTDEDRKHIAGCAAWLLSTGCAIDEEPRTIDSVIADALLFRDTYDMVVIDTLQSARIADHRAGLVESTINNVNALKALKKRLHKPVLVTAQAKDPPDRRETASGNLSPPTLNDLYGGRTITQEAATVTMVYRSNYGREHELDLHVPAEILVRKNQSGRPCRVQCTWNAKVGRFVEE